MDLDVLGKNAHALMGFKAELDVAMPEFRKALADFTELMADFAKIKETMAPALEWVAEQQKAIDAAKAAEEKKASEAAAAAAKTETAAEKPPEPPAQTSDKPLEHNAEVEASISEGQRAERSESEHSAG